jgi:hypothetical protein
MVILLACRDIFSLVLLLLQVGRLSKVFGLQLRPEQSSAPGALEEGALLKISSGPRLWRIVQEMRESQ